jgi:hypothetical protein
MVNIYVILELVRAKTLNLISMLVPSGMVHSTAGGMGTVVRLPDVRTNIPDQTATSSWTIADERKNNITPSGPSNRSNEKNKTLSVVVVTCSV